MKIQKTSHLRAVSQLLLLISSIDTSICEANNYCAAKVEDGKCNSNPSFMLKNCREECFDDKDFASFGYFIDEHDDDEVKRKAKLGCVDLFEEDEDSESCEVFAENGDCLLNPGFMLWNCAKSCLVCRDPEDNTFPIGVAQQIHVDDVNDNEAIEKTIDVIVETFTYMNTIMTEPKYASVRATCQNNDNYCAALAANSDCEMPEDYDDLPEDDEAVLMYDFMMTECAPACQTCEDFVSDEDAEIVGGCMADTKTNIFGPGDLNRMFERLVGESPEGDAVVSKSDVNVLSRPSHPPDFKGEDSDATDYVLGPWVVTLDNFLSDEECDRLVELGAAKGYDRSTLEEEDDYTEEELIMEKDGEDAYRTSQNTWCMDDECYKDPTTQHVLEKLSNATGIPDTYSEHLQLLSYVPGQYYKEHHDFITDSIYQPPGPRMLTFFLYLNDVEEGGATRMVDLTGDDGGISIDIQPKKGMALIWPSVLDEDPLMMDQRTYHEALPVLKGRKYGANAWFHMRSYKNEPCEYDEMSNLTFDYDEQENDDEDDYEEGDSDEDYIEDGSQLSDEL